MRKKFWKNVFTETHLIKSLKRAFHFTCLFNYLYDYIKEITDFLDL